MIVRYIKETTKMPAVRHCSRIDTFELKVQMERRLGSQKAMKYFNLLTRFLSLKLGKSEFNKLCIRLIGREHIHHHNELIKAIIKNATVSNAPPPRQVKRDIPLTFKDPRNGLESLCRDVFPQSPKRGRTPNLRERKFKDRPSPLGLNDNNIHISQDLPTAKVQEQQQSALNPVTSRRIPVTAPFGINIHSKETRKMVHSGTETCHYSGQFPGTSYLEKRLKQKLEKEGLGISMDCVNLLNTGLDSYLKRAIKSKLAISGSRSSHNQGRRFETSLLDFRVATETNPNILGENWRMQLEGINLFAYEQLDGFDNSLNFMSE